MKFEINTRGTVLCHQYPDGSFAKDQGLEITVKVEFSDGMLKPQYFKQFIKTPSKRMTDLEEREHIILCGRALQFLGKEIERQAADGIPSAKLDNHGNAVYSLAGKNYLLNKEKNNG